MGIHSGQISTLLAYFYYFWTNQLSCSEALFNKPPCCLHTDDLISKIILEVDDFALLRPWGGGCAESSAALDSNDFLGAGHVGFRSILQALKRKKKICWRGCASDAAAKTSNGGGGKRAERRPQMHLRLIHSEAVTPGALWQADVLHC